MTFMADMSRAANNIGQLADKRVRRVALAAFAEINRNSPVDKGTFRANWVASIDTIDRTYDLEKTKADIRQSVSVATAAIMDGARCGTTIYISNSVPYAIKLEDGYSPQALAGVVSPAITVIRNKIESGRL
jgi:hypothetical protein